MPGLDLQLIVGLGNPGAEHQKTCHNAGFWFVDALADRARAEFRSDGKFHGQVASCVVAGRSVWLLKPTTYMNRSGMAVSAIVNYFRIETSAVLVVYDELDLPPGTVRLKFGGGHAGHNGMRDVITQLGDGFWRLRLGIGHPRDSAIPQQDVADYVLGPPATADGKAINAAILRALDAWPAIEAGEFERAMLLLHTKKEKA